MGLKKLFTLPVIMILAAVLRLSFLGSVPISLNWDEISMGYTAYSVAETGRDEWGEFLPLFFRSYGEWKSPVYIYLLVPFVQVLGMNAWAVRLPSAIAGLLAVYLIYLIGTKLYSKNVGLWAALLLTLTPWHLVLSRPAFEANVSLTLLLLGIYGIISASLKHWDYRYLAISLLGFGLAPHTYNSGKIIVPFIVLYLIYTTKFYKSLKKCLMYLLVLAGFAFPIILSMFSGRAQYRYTQVGVTTDQTSLTKFYDNRKTFPLPELGNKLLFNQATFFVYKVSDNWLSYLSPSFLFVEAGDHKQHHVSYRGVLYLAIGIFIVSSFRSKEDKRLPLVLIALGLLPGALTRDTEHVLRTILAIPGFILLASLGADYFYSAVPIRPLWRKGVSWLLFIEVVSFLLMYFLWYPKSTASDWQFGHEQVANYVQAHEGEYDQIIMTKWFGEPQLFLAFYNKWDPVWYQTENKKLLGYEAAGHIWLDQLPEYHFGKYTFRYINWEVDKKDSKYLYISKNGDFYTDSLYQLRVLYPNGDIVFDIVKGAQ